MFAFLIGAAAGSALSAGVFVLMTLSGMLSDRENAECMEAERIKLQKEREQLERVKSTDGSKN